MLLHAKDKDLSELHSTLMKAWNGLDHLYSTVLGACAAFLLSLYFSQAWLWALRLVLVLILALVFQLWYRCFKRLLLWIKAVEAKLGPGTGGALLDAAPLQGASFYVRLFMPAAVLLGSSLALDQVQRLPALGAGLLLLAQSSSLSRLKNQASQYHRHA